jgi:N-acetylglucosaminyl-diphospho-decaprenol L-rhamnosyltransferase
MTEKKPAIVLSVVSHGQLRLIDALLSDLERQIYPEFKIVLTINIPEDESVLAKYAHLPLEVIRNGQPKGFGANHNAAFRATASDIFVIVNPDIRIPSMKWEDLFAHFNNPRVGACAPLILSAEGTVEDSARRFPTFSRLFARIVFGRRASDFIIDSVAHEVDWAAGMFVTYRSAAYSKINGFDERYFMYMEDADICRRLSRAGWSTVVTPEVSVIHNAQRASRRNMRHLRWHLGSAFRFLFLANA